MYRSRWPGRRGRYASAPAPAAADRCRAPWPGWPRPAMVAKAAGKTRLTTVSQREKKKASLRLGEDERGYARSHYWPLGDQGSDVHREDAHRMRARCVLVHHQGWGMAAAVGLGTPLLVSMSTGRSAGIRDNRAALAGVSPRSPPGSRSAALQVRVGVDHEGDLSRQGQHQVAKSSQLLPAAQVERPMYRRPEASTKSGASGAHLGGVPAAGTTVGRTVGPRPAASRGQGRPRTGRPPQVITGPRRRAGTTASTGQRPAPGQQPDERRP
jgi:hypothetical protein